MADAPAYPEAMETSARLPSCVVPAEITLTPLSDQGLRLLDALEARIDERPYRSARTPELIPTG